MGVGRALARTLFYALALVWAAVDEQVDEQLTADDLVQAEDDIADDVALHACTSCRRPQQINTRAVIFNRVPKCGSTTLERIIKKQARHRGFVFSRSKDYVNNSIDEVEQRRFAEHVTAMAKRGRVVYDRHVLYVNFARFGVPTPAYINLLRDPLRMQVSAYYFWRDCICTSRKSFCRHAWQASPSAPVCNVTIDDVYAEVKETTPVVGVITRFFCGQESACLAADPQPAVAAVRAAEDGPPSGDFGIVVLVIQVLAPSVRHARRLCSKLVYSVHNELLLLCRIRRRRSPPQRGSDRALGLAQLAAGSIEGRSRGLRGWNSIARLFRREARIPTGPARAVLLRNLKQLLLPVPILVVTWTAQRRNRPLGAQRQAEHCTAVDYVTLREH